MIRQLHELYENQFATELGKVVSHSRPIDELSHLKGRQTQLTDISRAVMSPGRHVFVYGERGVGKTSLAKTAARQASTNEECFKQIGCSRGTTFDEIVRLMLGMFSPEKLRSVVDSRGFSLGSFLGFSASKVESQEAPGPISVTMAADLLSALDKDGRNLNRVVVIDEIDRLETPDVRGKLADLLKLLGDQGAGITIIMTGVGSDLTQILGSHASSFRQLAQIKLERLDYTHALDIVDDALSRFGLDWEVEPTRTARFRVASIANGFPYYVHLLAEKLLYAVYEDRAATSVGTEHLRSAISAAVSDAQEEIRKPYDLATRGRRSMYKYLVWAVADSWALEREVESVFRSYQGICARLDVDAVDRAKINGYLSSLKKQGYGFILKAGYRRGMYEFSENIVRGYVRLCASSEDVDLNDLGPDQERLVSPIRSKEKRYVNPARMGGPPAGFAR